MKSTLKDENGAILIIVALLASVLLLFTGIAVDTNILSTSKAQQRHNAEYIALAALKAYNKTPGSKSTKLAQAISRSSEIASQNVFLAEAFLATHGDGSKQLGSEGNPDTHGKITPGIWYFAPLDETNACNFADPTDPAAVALPQPCPCSADNGAEWATPCFRSLDLSASGNLEVNAFRVELKTDNASPIRTLFSKVGSNRDYHISSAATAAVVPLRGIFLLDLSRSSHSETHLPFEKTGGGSGRKPVFTNSSEYTFRFESNGSCPAKITIPTAAPAPIPAPDTPCFYHLVNGAIAPTCNLDGGEIPGLFSSIYNTRRPEEFIDRVRPSGAAVATKHYKEDYECYEVSYFDEPRLADPSSHTSVTDERYLIDAYIDNDYDGPEPLSSMLFGTHHALELFRKRAIPGDGVGVIGFDSSASIKVVVGSEKKIRGLEFQQGDFTTANTAFSEFKEAIDLRDPTDTGPTLANKKIFLERRITKHMLFPRTTSYANFPEALDVALETLINSQGARQAENFVALMSDGLTTCTMTRDCKNNFNGFSNSLQETITLLEDRYIPNDVKFHMLLNGSGVSPHTTLRPYKSAGGGAVKCMDQDIAELRGVDLVNTTDYRANTPAENYHLMKFADASFFGPNQLYNIVKKTNGLWIPIREACDDGVADTDPRDFLDLKCAEAEAAAAGSLPKCSGTEELCDYVDTAGRLICDPSERAPRDQMRDAVDQIFGRNPYMLVDVSVSE